MYGRRILWLPRWCVYKDESGCNPMDATIQLAVIRTTEAALFDVERTVCRGRGKLLGSRRIYMRVWLQYISWEQCVHKLSLYPHSCNTIKIGNNVLIAPGVQINTASHPVEWPERRNPDFENNPQAYFCKTYARPVTIGDNCWIGAGADCPRRQCRWGDNVTVAAGAVVTQSFPGNCLIGGVPAKILKRLWVELCTCEIISTLSNRRQKPFFSTITMQKRFVCLWDGGDEKDCSRSKRIFSASTSVSVRPM